MMFDGVAANGVECFFVDAHSYALHETRIG